MTAIHATAADFDSHIASGVVLVDFYADWCGPCQMMMPAVEELAKQYAGRAKVIKVNTDEAGEIAGRYDVMSIPTFVILKDGEVADTITGGVPVEKLTEALDKALA
jgi:thioredoxin 1